ncbi:MAG: hypothetical protein KAZ11_01990 [Chitinophagaceae bacterium]|nr:hypothetical protein [Chitinophagaceae bacterium]
MKFIKAFIFFLLLGLQQVAAQEIKIDSIQKIDKNIVKINLIGFSVNGQYERILSKRVSIALSYKILPNGKFIFRGLIPTTDPQARESLDNLILSNSAITPEVRFYLGKKGYGQGFYLAPFYRNAKFGGKGIGIDFTLDNGQTATFNMEGKINANTFGLLMGAQWKLGKNFWLDWQIFGPHYGGATGSIIGVSNVSLSATEQNNLANALRDINFPFAKENISVKPNQATLELSGPWAGLRTAISLGFDF